jgi:hypothetical protein
LSEQREVHDLHGACRSARRVAGQRPHTIDARIRKNRRVSSCVPLSPSPCLLRCVREIEHLHTLKRRSSSPACALSSSSNGPTRHRQVAAEAGHRELSHAPVVVWRALKSGTLRARYTAPMLLRTRAGRGLRRFGHQR